MPLAASPFDAIGNDDASFRYGSALSGSILPTRSRSNPVFRFLDPAYGDPIMPEFRHRGFKTLVVALAFFLVLLAGLEPTRGDLVTLKNGAVLRGTVDKDNAFVSIFDGLKRVVIRDSKVTSITPEPASSRQQQERFSLVQPLETHGGTMPSHALGIQSSPWDEFGQRIFQYSYFTDAKTRRTVRMKQAINEIGPEQVKFRGIDGFWIAQVDLNQIPKDVILGLLGRVDRANKNERLRVGRMLIQAGWYAEALDELDRLSEEFPELAETIDNVRRVVRDLQARQTLEEVEQRLRVHQPRKAETLLRTFPADGLSTDLIETARSQLRDLQVRADADKTLAGELRSMLDGLSEPARSSWREPVFEILKGLREAPETARERLSAFADSRSDAAFGPANRLALALSGWAVGAEHAVADLDRAGALWQARMLLSQYLATSVEAQRYDLLQGLEIPVEPAPEADAETDAETETETETASKPIDLETATRLVRHLPPPLADGDRITPGVPLLRRVRDDPNPTPTEYALLLPPEYHPLRSYPAVVALHDGRGPNSALAWWGEEAARRGYIVIAPEYNPPGRNPPDYQYTPDEHAAVELALRDARKRLSIDSDRVFLGGQVLGGNMAWDVGLSHPDLWAGVVVISGLPMKYVPKVNDNAAYVPLYVAIGDLATAATEAIVADRVKGMISKTWDVTYVEYIRRGLEPLPEEAPAVFDWMARRQRDPYQKNFVVSACRECDDRFFGVVVRDFLPDRITAPELVETLGGNIKSATIERRVSTPANLVSLTVNGVRRLDLWLDPEFLDFDQKIQVRVNGRRLFQDLVEPDLAAFLEDLRVRGDRSQLYWARIPLGG
ncbi:peptidase [soil metagenome]